MLSKFKIQPISKNKLSYIKAIINNKTKPIGSLGLLENMALQIAQIQETDWLKISYPTIFVCAGDHGITEEGVSPYPQDVTWQMVMNFISGGAAINVFSKQNGWNLKLVDAGVNHDFEKQLPIINFKVAKGTKNFLYTPAMEKHQMEEAITNGASLISNLENCNCVAFGEMGIGNTSSAAVIMSKITGINMEDCTGKGTGLNDEGLQHKTSVLKQAVKKHKANSPEAILATFGGFEIATIVGAILQAAQNKMLIIIDGFIVSSALLIAHAMHPNVLDYCIFAHQSDENGHQKLLSYLNVKPLLNLGMRLGEGTGAALALPLVQAAVNFYNEMASFEGAGVSKEQETMATK